MTIKEVQERVSEISNASGDDERAHSMEDDLYQDLLEAIESGEAEAPQAMCQIALTTKAMDFARWCA
jgi:DNA-binding FadR family transcriptional regulator